MSSERQIQANRKNARTSTGPRSKLGKANSSQNALRHGLTRPPDPALTMKWLKFILEGRQWRRRTGAFDARSRAAWELAEAQAQRDQVRRFELDKLQELQRQRPKEKSEDQTLRDLAHQFELTPGKVDPDVKKIISILMRPERAILDGLLEELRLLARYRNEAEARLRKAQRGG